jgi:alpha-ketoglutarate-dependent taurine dioxygenase
MSLTVERFTPLGAKILGADTDRLLNDERVPEIVLGALEENGVVVFPELGVDDTQQVAFARRLGDLIGSGHTGAGRSDQNPEIYYVGFGDDLNNELYVKGAFNWHLDGSTDDIPSKASLLSGRSVAAEGGDTQFVSTYTAYDRLSDEEKEQFATTRVVHSAENAYRKIDPNPSDELIERLRRVAPKVHPLVWTHRTGRRSLVLGATAAHIEGMPEDEGVALLDELLARATEPEQVLTHNWSQGDLVIWDNRGTLHRATHYSEDSGRRMHRVTLIGDEPIA